MKMKSNLFTTTLAFLCILSFSFHGDIINKHTTKTNIHNNNNNTLSLFYDKSDKDPIDTMRDILLTSDIKVIKETEEVILTLESLIKHSDLYNKEERERDSKRITQLKDLKKLLLDFYSKTGNLIKNGALVFDFDETIINYGHSFAYDPSKKACPDFIKTTAALLKMGVKICIISGAPYDEGKESELIEERFVKPLKQYMYPTDNKTLKNLTIFCDGGFHLVKFDENGDWTKSRTTEIDLDEKAGALIADILKDMAKDKFGLKDEEIKLWKNATEVTTKYTGKKLLLPWLEDNDKTYNENDLLIDARKNTKAFKDNKEHITPLVVVNKDNLDVIYLPPPYPTYILPSKYIDIFFKDLPREEISEEEITQLSGKKRKEMLEHGTKKILIKDIRDAIKDIRDRKEAKAKTKEMIEEKIKTMSEAEKKEAIKNAIIDSRLANKMAKLFKKIRTEILNRIKEKLGKDLNYITYYGNNIRIRTTNKQVCMEKFIRDNKLNPKYVYYFADKFVKGGTDSDVLKVKNITCADVSMQKSKIDYAKQKNLLNISGGPERLYRIIATFLNMLEIELSFEDALSELEQEKGSLSEKHKEIFKEFFNIFYLEYIDSKKTPDINKIKSKSYAA